MSYPPNNFSKSVYPGRKATPAKCTQADTRAAEVKPLAAPFFPVRRAYGARVKFFKVRLPVAEQLLFLNLPAIRRHIAWRERVCVVRAAQTLIASGLYSQNTAAPAVGMTQAVLSKWIRRLEEFGEEGLLENRAQMRIARRQIADGIICKLSFKR